MTSPLYTDEYSEFSFEKKIHSFLLTQFIFCWSECLFFSERNSLGCIKFYIGLLFQSPSLGTLKRLQVVIIIVKDKNGLFGYKAHSFFEKNLSLGGKLVLKLGCVL